MISKPQANSPRCGGKLTVLDTIDVSRHILSVSVAGAITIFCLKVSALNAETALAASVKTRNKKQAA